MTFSLGKHVFRLAKFSDGKRVFAPKMRFFRPFVSTSIHINLSYPRVSTTVDTSVSSAFVYVNLYHTVSSACIYVSSCINSLFTDSV